MKYGSSEKRFQPEENKGAQFHGRFINGYPRFHGKSEWRSEKGRTSPSPFNRFASGVASFSRKLIHLPSNCEASAKVNISTLTRQPGAVLG